MSDNADANMPKSSAGYRRVTIGKATILINCAAAVAPAKETTWRLIVVNAKDYTRVNSSANLG